MHLPVMKHRTRGKPLVIFAFFFAVLFALYPNFILNDVSKPRAIIETSVDNGPDVSSRATSVGPVQLLSIDDWMAYQYPVVAKLAGAGEGVVAGVVAGNKWTSRPFPSVDLERLPGKRMPLLPALTATDWMTPPVELKGQVTLDTTFGKELNRLARLPSVHLVLEIGTWFGGGSSWCIAQGLCSSIKDAAAPDKWLITLEMFEPAWQYASQTLQRLPVTCMKGGTVGLQGYLSPEQMTEEDRASEHYKLYYERDVNLAQRGNTLLESLCSTYDFDFVLIDGNEYTGLAEYEIVERVCRPRYMALHDTGTLKTRKAETLLAEKASKWTKISSGMDAAGWSVYESVQSESDPSDGIKYYDQ